MIFVLKNYFIFILNIDGKPSSPEYGDIGGSSQQKTNYHGPWSSKVLRFYFGFVFVFFWCCVIRSYSEKLGNGQNNLVSQEFLPSLWNVLWIILYFPDFDLNGDLWYPSQKMKNKMPQWLSPGINCIQKGSEKKKRKERDIKTLESLCHLCTRSTLESSYKGKELFRNLAGALIHA